MNIGDKYGKLTVIGFCKMPNGIGKTQAGVICNCDCGVTGYVGQKYRISKGQQIDCNCGKNDRIGAARRKYGATNYRHGMIHTPAYNSWAGMKQRCLDPNYERYEEWGGRGIEVCERWMDFRNFFEDMGERPKGTTLDRKDNDGNYEPGNCRWATLSEQRLNQRGKGK